MTDHADPTKIAHLVRADLTRLRTAKEAVKKAVKDVAKDVTKDVTKVASAAKDTAKATAKEVVKYLDQNLTKTAPVSSTAATNPNSVSVDVLDRFRQDFTNYRYWP
jgi:phage tail tape-measure protein